VGFSGVQQKETLKLLEKASQLTASQKQPPRTQTALRRRAELDIPNLVKALHSRAHYNAKINLDIDFSTQPISIIYHVDPGPVYPLGGYKVLPESLDILPHQLGISLNKPAYPKDILDAEEDIIAVMTRKGYPLAQIKDREVVADQESKQIFITVQVDSGPLTYFGETTIDGNCMVRDAFIRKKITWCKGNVYDPRKIDCTIDALDATGVFSSINIDHAEKPNEDHSLPMTIQVSEGKQRSIGFGLIYSTQRQKGEGLNARGGGITAEWEHRNFRGMGEKLSFKTDILEYFQEATLMYVKPDFMRNCQDLLWIVDLEHDKTEGFDKKSASFSGIIERQINNRTGISYGGTYMFLRDDDTDNEGSFNLIKTPMQLKWADTDDPLDPTFGQSLFVRTVPTLEVMDSPFAYCITTLTHSMYAPLSQSKQFVLAAKVNLGTILGASKRKIPRSERFFAGSENTLRGYKYDTVSPLDGKNKPTGGRSLLIGTLEARWRATEKWGGVLFYDIGNVYSDPIPQFDKKMLQAVGVGVRYYTPVGPLRLDLAIPLNRRKKVDNAFQVYFSVGQAF
ncbi:MAG: autotransporter assembly complex family protein, partial [Waddliaceae bacterium]